MPKNNAVTEQILAQVIQRAQAYFPGQKAMWLWLLNGRTDNLATEHGTLGGSKILQAYSIAQHAANALLKTQRKSPLFTGAELLSPNLPIA